MKKRSTVKVDLYPILVDAVERGVTFGLNRAFKHTDTPSRESIAKSVENEVLNALVEVIRFDD